MTSSNGKNTPRNLGADVWFLAKIKRVYIDLPLAARIKLYCSLIQWHTDYCSVVWDQLTMRQRVRWKPYKMQGWESFWEHRGQQLALTRDRNFSGPLWHREESFMHERWHISASTEQELHISITSSSTSLTYEIDKQEGHPQINFTWADQKQSATRNIQRRNFGTPSHPALECWIHIMTAPFVKACKVLLNSEWCCIIFHIFLFLLFLRVGITLFFFLPEIIACSQSVPTIPVFYCVFFSFHLIANQHPNCEK